MTRFWSVQDIGLERLSFPDEDVLTSTIDAGSHVLAFDVTGAFIENNVPETLGPCRVRISGWQRVEGRVFFHVPNQWRPNDDWLSDFPKSILESERRSSGLILRGFGMKSGLWTEVEFVGEGTCVELTDNSR